MFFFLQLKFFGAGGSATACARLILYAQPLAHVNTFPLKVKILAIKQKSVTIL
jgi:hypothetical protein